MHTLCRLLGVAALNLFGVAGGAAEDAPDLEFLAYLGSWQGTDEEWMAVARWETEEQEDGEDTVESRQETDDD
jgi:hypothetical protein